MPIVFGVAGGVVEVNTEWNYAVLNVGKSDGVRAGAWVLLYNKEADRVRQAVVNRVEEHFSVADPVDGPNTVPVSVGDRAIFNGGLGLELQSNSEFAVAILPLGDKYVGGYRTNAYQGMGMYVWGDGSRYLGTFSCGKRHGQGLLRSSDGTSYSGGFAGDSYHGEGEYSKPGRTFGTQAEAETKGSQGGGGGNGIRYSGTFSNGVFSGKGTLSWALGKYQGEFREGRLEGRGTLQMGDGTWYEGEFSAGVFSGFGSFWRGGVQYRGNFKSGLFDGSGRLQDELGVKEGRFSGGVYVEAPAEPNVTMGKSREGAGGVEDSPGPPPSRAPSGADRGAEDIDRGLTLSLGAAVDEGGRASPPNEASTVQAAREENSVLGSIRSGAKSIGRFLSDNSGLLQQLAMLAACYYFDQEYGISEKLNNLTQSTQGGMGSEAVAMGIGSRAAEYPAYATPKAFQSSMPVPDLASPIARHSYEGLAVGTGAGAAGGIRGGTWASQPQTWGGGLPASLPMSDPNALGRWSTAAGVSPVASGLGTATFPLPQMRFPSANDTRLVPGTQWITKAQAASTETFDAFGRSAGKSFSFGSGSRMILRDGTQLQSQVVGNSIRTMTPSGTITATPFGDGLRIQYPNGQVGKTEPWLNGVREILPNGSVIRTFKTPTGFSSVVE